MAFRGVAISFSTLLPLLNFYDEIAASSRPPGRSRLLAMTLRGFSTFPDAWATCHRFFAVCFPPAIPEGVSTPSRLPKASQGMAANKYLPAG